MSIILYTRIIYSPKFSILNLLHTLCKPVIWSDISLLFSVLKNFSFGSNDLHKVFPKNQCIHNTLHLSLITKRIFQDLCFKNQIDQEMLICRNLVKHSKINFLSCLHIFKTIVTVFVYFVLFFAIIWQFFLTYFTPFKAAILTLFTFFTYLAFHIVYALYCEYCLKERLCTRI